MSQTELDQPIVGSSLAAKDTRPEIADPPLQRAFVVIFAVIGLATRVGILVSTSSIGRPDSDELIAGLMARHIGTDGYPFFFWGQGYGGTPTLALVGLSLRLFGNSVVAMRLPGLLIASGCSILVWRVATRLLPRRGAQLAGLLSWVGAPPAVYFSVREHLFYVPTVFFGLLAAVFAFRIRERGGPGNWVGLGLSLLLGLWCMPTIAYFALPALVIVAAPFVEAYAARREVPVVPTVATVAALAIVGAIGMVWLVQGTPRAWREVDFDYWANVRFFFVDGLPGLLGFREIFTYRWIGGPLGAAAYVAVLAVIGAGFAEACRRRAWDAVGLAAFPFLFALFPQATDQPNMRYLFFAVPFVAVAVARVAQRRGWTAYAAVVVALVLTGVSLQHLYVVSEVDRSTRVGMVGDLDGTIAVLQDEQVDAVWAGYWIAYRLDFETSEQIVAAPPFKEGRYPPYAEVVAADPRPAWVVTAGPQRDSLVDSLQSIGVEARERSTGEFVVVLPERPVSPAELDEPARSEI